MQLLSAADDGVPAGVGRFHDIAGGAAHQQDDVLKSMDQHR